MTSSRTPDSCKSLNFATLSYSFTSSTFVTAKGFRVSYVELLIDTVQFRTEAAVSTEQRLRRLPFFPLRVPPSFPPLLNRLQTCPPLLQRVPHPSHPPRRSFAWFCSADPELGRVQSGTAFWDRMSSDLRQTVSQQ